MILIWILINQHVKEDRFSFSGQTILSARKVNHGIMSIAECKQLKVSCVQITIIVSMKFAINYEATKFREEKKRTKRLMNRNAVFYKRAINQIN